MTQGQRGGWRLATCTLFALLAFAANSLLCRAALLEASIDPASFTMMRLASGALLLLMLSRARQWRGGRGGGDWLSALALFAYALCFSLAYVSMDAGVGALLLFGLVQVTMYGAGLASGERPARPQWLGLFVALGGLVYLVLPGMNAPPPQSALMMALAGVAWGVYSLRAPGGEGALGANAGNFVRTLPMAVVAFAWLRHSAILTPRGVLLAALSGALASGLGYVAWYAALKGLKTTTASLLQLAVPALAAMGGVILLGELLSARLVLASLLTLGGIGTALLFHGGRN